MSNSITCNTQQDTEPHVANTGATGGLLGKRGIVVGQNPTRPPACEAKQQQNKHSEFTVGSLLLRRIAQTDPRTSGPKLAEPTPGAWDPNNDPCMMMAGINRINSLLADADACAQQDNADAMVDFAMLPRINNQLALVDNAVVYRKHPRNALNNGGVVPSTLFCGTAPRNLGVSGVVNGQLARVDPGLFGSPNTATVAFGANE